MWESAQGQKKSIRLPLETFKRRLNISANHIIMEYDH